MANIVLSLPKRNVFKNENIVVFAFIFLCCYSMMIYFCEVGVTNA